MKKTFVIYLFFLTNIAIGQNYHFSSGEVSFFAEASVEDIAAKSFELKSTFDPGTREIVFDIPMKSFVFKKSLMKQHFNEKYVESDKYPTATFKGKVEKFDINQSGEQSVSASGELEIHGVKRNVNFKGTLAKKLDELQLTATFIARFEDHKIKIPKLFWSSVAEQVEVSVDIVYKEK